MTKPVQFTLDTKRGEVIIAVPFAPILEAMDAAGEKARRGFSECPDCGHRMQERTSGWKLLLKQMRAAEAKAQRSETKRKKLALLDAKRAAEKQPAPNA